MLSVSNLHVSYGAISALNGISFEVKSGAIVTLIGGNGAGKTTTLSTIFEKIIEINRTQGITILLVEQNANLALEISTYAYVLETGHVAMEGESKKLRADPQLKATYLGG